MSYLLDTHILIWYRLEPERLSEEIRSIISSGSSKKFISTTSIWEISLKFGLGKLELGGHNPEEFMQSALSIGFFILPPAPEDYASFHCLPEISGHTDPFDRMLIWQAIRQDLVLLSHDRKLPEYGIHGLKLA